MSGFDPAPAAAALIAARADRRPAGPLPAAIAPRTEADGAAVQYEVARQRGAAIGGFKIGATGKRMQQVLDLDHPAAGFMAASDLHASGIVLPYAQFRHVALECELGVRLGRDLPPGSCTRDQASDAVADLFAAIEIVENRYGPPPIGDLKTVGTPTLIADQVYHAAAVLGAPFANWRDLDLAAIEGRAIIDGATVHTGRGAELLGHPLNGLAWLAAGDVAAAFGGLRAGQVVMLGSVTPPIWLDAPCTARFEFDNLPPVRLILA